MSYHVLARQWRPKTLQEVVGQDHVVRALNNALTHQRLHHAYLFSGTRGVGKTTLARILAACLNCEQGVTAQPCGECSACVAVAAGRFMDLIEVDAASRTKVEDTRDLLENVPYAPTVGRFKVYLIDEVHMLSTHSFNALLKTLEEPPSHVKFLLATTEPQKLPATVLSRCLQFNLKRVPAERIATYLEQQLTTAQINFEPAALRLLGRAAAGSLRDALSLTDQALAFGDNRLLTDDVQTMLGSVAQAPLCDLIAALASEDAQAVFVTVQPLLEGGADYYAVVEDLLSVLHRIAVAQVVPERIDKTDPEAGRIQELAKTIAPETIQLFYQLGLHARRDLPLAPDPRDGFEMALLRMLAFKPVESLAPVPLESMPQHEPATAANPIALETPITASSDAVLELNPQNWSTYIKQWQLDGLVGNMLSHCILQRIDANTLFLHMDQAHAALLNRDYTRRIEQQVQEKLGKPIKLKISVSNITIETPAVSQQRQQCEQQQQALESLHKDPHVNTLRQHFNASLDERSVTINDAL